MRGAPAIAIVGCLSLAAELAETESSYKEKAQLQKDVSSKLDYLVSARPTAVNMKKAAEELTVVSKNLCEGGISLQDMVKSLVSCF